MKIVNLDQFLSMPPNTVYSKYEPHVFGELCIKGESIHDIDFFYQPINGSFKYKDTDEFLENLAVAEGGKNIPMDFDCQSKDGIFEYGQLFAVWEDKDVSDLIERLKLCINKNNGVYE